MKKKNIWLFDFFETHASAKFLFLMKLKSIFNEIKI